MRNILLLFDERWHQSSNYDLDEENKLCSFIKGFKFKNDPTSSKFKTIEDEPIISNSEDLLEESQNERIYRKILIPISEEDLQSKFTKLEVKSQEDIFPQIVENPKEVKTVGRPPELKRMPSYIENKRFAEKRKASGDMRHEDLKRQKSLAQLFPY